MGYRETGERRLMHVIRDGNIFILPARETRALAIRTEPGVPAKSDTLTGAFALIGAAALILALFSRK